LSSWRIRTPQAEASVVSSDFSIASAEGRTAMRVTHGRVQFSSLNGKAEEVGSGKRVIVERNLPPIVTSCRAGTALLLTSREPSHTDWDKFNQLVTEKLLNARLWRMGFRVDVRHFEDVQPSDLADRAIVVVSLFGRGVGEPALQRIALARADVPVICLEPDGYPALGMTSRQLDVGFGFLPGSSSVEFLATDHTLSAGLHGSQQQLLRHIIGWGQPAGEAALIAHLPDHPEQAIVFAYDTDQQMENGRAPARRVGLFLDPSEISDQSEISWRLLDAAVNWCLESNVTLPRTKKDTE
jgi:hypothetical protein